MTDFSYNTVNNKTISAADDNHTARVCWGIFFYGWAVSQIMH